MKKDFEVKEYFKAFEGREGRYYFLMEYFKEEFDQAGKILDVGCDENYLKSIYKEKVFGVDIYGNPDRKTDLEAEALKFADDKSYDLVICTEVLEHIDNLHEVFEELIRVSSKYVLISLPNCSSTKRLRSLILTGRNRKFYGLPFKKPVDRHKWFFSYKEIIDFMQHHAISRNLKIKSLILHYSVRWGKERRFAHRLKQYLEEVLIRLLKWKNQSSDVIILLEKQG